MPGCAATQTRSDIDGSDKRYLLAADYFNKGMVAPALEELLKSVELNPNNADAHNLLGLVFMRKGVDDEELSVRSQCLKGEELRLEKQDTDAHFKKAEEQFKKAVELKPGFSEALNNLAVISIRAGRYDAAIDFAQKALANITYREPFAAEGNLGLAYLGKSDYAHAAKELRQALFQEPRFCVGRYRLAKVYYEQKEYEHAGEELDKVTSDKGCPIQEAYHLAGMVALRREQRDRAAELFEKCVALAPKSCLARECELASKR